MYLWVLLVTPLTNNGKLTFSEVAYSSGVANDTSEGVGAVSGDFDNDGDLDIYVANYFGVNQILSIVEPIDITNVERHDKVSGGNPNGFTLLQNFPNPFNNGTRIQYQLTQSGFVSLHITNLLGQEIRTFEEGFKNEGQYEVTWDGKDNNGLAVPSGVYINRIIYQTKGGTRFMETKKMLELK